MAVTERDMASALAEQKALDTQARFLDGVNTMMLTGTTAQRDLLRKKALSHEEICRTRIIRGAGSPRCSGAGNPSRRSRTTSIAGR